MDQIREMFSQIEDTRHTGYVEYNLVDVLILIMGSVLSGITELADMMVYFASKIDFYSEHFDIEKYPSKPTLSRILNMIDGDAVGQIIVQIMGENAGNIGDIIAVNGKAIRSTGKKGKVHSFLQILTADAMHCQKGTCAKIVKNGGKYILGLKGNQSNLSEDVMMKFYCSLLKIYETNVDTRKKVFGL